MSLNVYILCLLTTSLPHQQSVPGNEHFRSHDLSSAPEIGPSCTIFRVGFLLLPPSPARNRVFANVGLPLATIPHEVLLHHYSQNRAFALVFGVVGFLLLPPLPPPTKASIRARFPVWWSSLCSCHCCPPKSSPPCSISGGGCLLAA